MEEIMDQQFLHLSLTTLFLGEIDTKLLYLIIAFVFGIASFVVYFTDLVKGPTHPHPISWLVWLVTQVIATVSAFIGEGGYGAYYGVFYCFTITTILIYTYFKFKWEKVRVEDWVCLGICLVGVLVWLVFNTPLVGLIAAIGIDVYAFYPSIRKGFEDPWSESLWGWGLMIPNILFTIMALESYNILTLAYPLAMLLGTFTLVMVYWICRRKK